MATITSAQRGYWNQPTTWVGGVVPVDGDSVIIAEGHTVNLNVDMSSFPNGLAALTVNGDLGFQEDIETCLKMNGNINGGGKLFVAYVDAVSSLASVEYFAQHPTYENVYYSVDFDGETFYGVSVDVNSFIEEVFEGDFIYNEVNSLEEVNQTPGTYMVAQDSEGYDGIYINPLSGELPDGEFSIVMSCIRPVEGAEYLSYLLFNSSGTINVPTFHGYGWYPEKEYTTIAQDVAAGQNTIVLTEDMGFQAGDVIGISVISEFSSSGISEGLKGIYTVSAYDSETKTVTLSANLQTDRIIGDYVFQISRPIKITRTSGTSSIVNTNINDVVIVGVLSSVQMVTGLYLVHGDYCRNWTFKHVSTNKTLIMAVCDVTLEDVIIYNSGTSTLLAYTTFSGKNIRVLNGSIASISSHGDIDGLIALNCINFPVYSDGNVLNGKIYAGLKYMCGSTYKNCIIKGMLDLWISFSTEKNQFINCEVVPVDGGYSELIIPFKAENTLFNSFEVLTKEYLITDFSESFNHNQIQGQYKAWLKGGNIETDFDGETCLPGRLIFNCESADYPVFRDFPVLLPGYRTQRWQALCNKSFTGGEVKMELIDPTADPLIDPTAAPLASYSLPDESEINLPLKLGFKSDKAMMAILRISAKNTTGTVEVDTRLIENRVNYGH